MSTVINVVGRDAHGYAVTWATVTLSEEMTEEESRLVAASIEVIGANASLLPSEYAAHFMSELAIHAVTLYEEVVKAIGEHDPDNVGASGMDPDEQHDAEEGAE